MNYNSKILQKKVMYIECNNNKIKKIEYGLHYIVHILQFYAINIFIMHISSMILYNKNI